MTDSEAITPSAPSLDFIRTIVTEDIKTNKWGGRVVTRFPPEPNGYLHIGHAKSICLNFGIASEFGGECHLRFDDTNPAKEEHEYVDSIIEDVKWLGWDWGKHLYYGSDYFGRMYEYAIQMIKLGKAYVDDLSAAEIREHRGTLTKPGKDSPYRNRSIEENLDLFTRMRSGEFADGSRVLRAKIDMASPNINLRDPVMYRILHASHQHTGDKWCIYPMYDWAHGIEDSIENITHSICTLEFESHRPLYDWFLDQLGAYHPRQIEFARLNVTYMMMSKRKLLELVREGHVSGWDDPRMPTISGMRRRGYTPESIREFAKRIGVAKADSTVDMALLEDCVRQDLNKHSARVMGVLKPLKVVITNYPEGQDEELDAVNNPEDESAGMRKVPFSREIYIEQDDFMENPPKSFYRLGLGREVRLRYAYFIKCEEAVKDTEGNIVELRCTYDPATRGGNALDGRKVKATLHWVSARHAITAGVRLYDHLFTKPNPNQVDESGAEQEPSAELEDIEETDAEYAAESAAPIAAPETAKKDWRSNINPNSLQIVTGAKLEPGLKKAKAGERYQFERLGYFCVDLDSKPGEPIFNRTVTLKDEWARMQKQQGGKK